MLAATGVSPSPVNSVLYPQAPPYSQVELSPGIVLENIPFHPVTPLQTLPAADTGLSVNIPKDAATIGPGVIAINGLIPVSVFPRWNFLLLAMNQLINHLDKIKLMSNDRYKTKVIVRTGIGSKKPLHPQYQHVGDFTDAVKKMCSNIELIKLNEAKDIFPAYKKALEREDGKSTIVVEYGDYYNEK
jgi:hypothetical protein